MHTHFIDTSSKIPYDIQFTSAPSACIQGGVNIETPFVISISAPDQNPHVIDLYARNSNSIYPSEINKWSHLSPIWTFEDTDKNPIKSITTTDTNIYYMDGQFLTESSELYTTACEFVGTSGYAEFYYRDSYPSTGSVYVIATMNALQLPLSAESYDGNVTVPGYSNSQIATITPIRIDALNPGGLSVTRDGLNPLNDSIHWVNHFVPVVITVTGINIDYDLDAYDCNGIVLNAPIKTEIQEEEPIPVEASIEGLPAEYQIWNYDNNGVFPEIKEYDENGFRVGGYILSNVIPLCAGGFNIINADAQIVSLSAAYDTTFMWISNPEVGYLHRISTPVDNDTLVNVVTAYCEEFPNTVFTGRLSSTDTVPIVTARHDSMSLSGFGGIYSIATDTRVDKKALFLSDIENNKIYGMGFDGTLQNTLDCVEKSPCGLALSLSGLYATFFEYPEIWKINPDTLVVENSASFITSGVDSLSTAYSSGDYSYKPVLVDTDSSNNVWATFSNPVSDVGHIYKFSADLSTVQYQLPLSGISPQGFNDSTPFDLKCSSRFVFVSLNKNSRLGELSYYPNGGIAMIDSNTGEVSYIVNDNVLKNPSYITIKETEGNVTVAVSCDNNKVFIFNASLLPAPTSLNPTVYTISNYSLITCGTENPNYGYDDFSGEPAIGGISFDRYGRIVVLNSYNNRIYYITLSNNRYSINTKLTMNFNTINDGEYVTSTGRYVDENGLQEEVILPHTVPSLRAQGDWLGWQFTMKSDGYTYPVDGFSTGFIVDDYDKYQYRKFNESWDISTSIKNNILIADLKENSILIDDYIGKSLGNNDTRYSMARSIFEKIANLPKNISDIDTCNIDAIYSYASMVDAFIDDYRFAFPADILRLMEVFSQNLAYIKGGRCECTQNYLRNTDNGYCQKCKHIHNTNLGVILDENYEISANVPYLAEYRYDRGVFHKFIPTTEYISTSGVDLHTHAQTLLPSTVDIDDYTFYAFIPTECGTLNVGTINWDDEKTTLDTQIPNFGYDKIYGKNQIIDKLFNYTLHKGLGFEMNPDDL